MKLLRDILHTLQISNVNGMCEEHTQLLAMVSAIFKFTYWGATERVKSEQ